MKIDFSDIHEITLCYIRELQLVHQAILESNDKDELLLTESKIAIASLERQDEIISEMLANLSKMEDFDVNREFEEIS